MLQDTDSWWNALRSPDVPTARVLLFPHAGGGPHSLRGLIDALPGDVEILGLTLPGRDRRHAEPPLTDAVEALLAARTALTPTTLPTVAIGCSLGALLAVRTTADPAVPVDRLVVLAQSPGTRCRWTDTVRDDSGLNRMLREVGGVPDEVLADPGIGRDLRERLRADLALATSAAAGFGKVRVDVPITVIGGLADWLVPAEAMPGWAGHTTAGSCRIVLLDGGHLAFLEPRHRGLVSAVLRDVLAGLGAA